VAGESDRPPRAVNLHPPRGLASGNEFVPSSRPLLGLLGAPLAAGFAALAIQAGATSEGARAGEPHRLLPDLTTMRIHSADLQIDRAGSEVYLRLTNRLANRGRGPLEIYPGTGSHDCDRDGDPGNDRDALQRVFLDGDGNRVFERDTDARSQRFKFGCKRYDPETGRWSVLDLARYELRRLRSGKAVARATKVAYCAVDSSLAFPKLPGAPGRGYYPRGGCTEDSTVGVSIGWADEYHYRLPGQELEVTGVRAGRYCLVSTGDPDNLLREAENSNNTRRTRIELHPGEKLVRTLPGRCRIGG
jgi:hypothetical protein